MKESPVLFATDLSDQCARGARFARDFADRHDRPLRVVHVVAIAFKNWLRGAYDILEDEEKRQRMKRRVDEWFREEAGESPDEIDICVGHPHEQLKQKANELDAAALLLGMHGRGRLKKLAVGSNALELAYDPPCPLGVVPADEDAHSSVGTVAVGTDFSPEAENAVDYAAGLAETLKQRLHIVHASNPPTFPALGEDDLPKALSADSRQEAVAKELQNTVERHRSRLEGLDYHTSFVEDSPTSGLSDFVTENEICILVLGHHKHRGHQAAVLTSFALQSIGEVGSTVFIVPTTSKNEDE